MKSTSPILIGLLILLLITTTFSNHALCQAEVEPWGNITGIRKQGQLFEFESIIKIKTGGKFTSTGKERQRPHYRRSGDEQIITTNIDSLFVSETVRDEPGEKIEVTLTITAHADVAFDGAYFCLQLPGKDYTAGRVRLAGVSGSMSSYASAGKNYDGMAKGAQFSSGTRNLKIKFEEPLNIMLRKDGNGSNDLQLYAALKLNGLSKGGSVQQTFSIEASGHIDRARVNLKVNTNQPGRQFDGLGGNFRLQNQTLDPEVIDYCLQNLRVAYGRVELPWLFWQPNADVDPTAVADSGKLHPAVKKAMQMAHRLDSLGIPIILSAWFPPDWAIVGKPNFSPVNGVWGNPLNQDDMSAIYKSIADYLLYLKNKYAVDVKLFSFNEPDLGINIRLTAQQHNDFIKGCGAYFAAHGLATKMLLGDNSDATTYKFIYPALNDPEAKPFIGAVSFHSWRGWDAGTLQHWADAAAQLNIPLIVGEGSIDAAAWNYPDIFQEPTYALKEINLYTRLLAICQPSSILQWQLTADYSPLIGGGIFGNNEPLHPGQRFYNLKQLSISPKGLYAMPINGNTPEISCAAVGDNDKGIYTVHLVNNGAKRKATLQGLPLAIKQLQIYVTSNELSMKDGGLVKVKNGKAKFKLPESSFTTLLSQ